MNAEVVALHEWTPPQKKRSAERREENRRGQRRCVVFVTSLQISATELLSVMDPPMSYSASSNLSFGVHSLHNGRDVFSTVPQSNDSFPGT